MSPQGTSEDKTEKPTARRRRKAREEGQIAYSSEINNFVVLLTAVLILWLFSRTFLDTLLNALSQRLGDLGSQEFTRDGAVLLGREALLRIARCILPLGASVLAAGFLASVVQTGGLLSFKQISPDLKKINPLQGFRNLFSASALTRLLVALAKMVLIGVVLWCIVRPRLSWATGLVGRGPNGILEAGAHMSFLLLIWVACSMVLVAVADYAWQRYQHNKKLMMTKTEVKEEQKRDEGKPEILQRQRERRQEMAQSRMMESVPEADVVVTNPTRIAVALQWDETSMEAPCVVAKGRGFIARRIREIARENEVPVVERKPLAQALEKAVEVGTEVPPHLYYAVAEVLSFVMKERSR
jgi:flagellar biosynthetic protein FlhB